MPPGTLSPHQPRWRERAEPPSSRAGPPPATERYAPRSAEPLASELWRRVPQPVRRQREPKHHPAVGTLLWLYRLALLAGLAYTMVVGGPVLRVAAVAAAVFALWGDWDGVVCHALRIVGLAGAIAAGLAFGIPLGDWVGSYMGVAAGWMGLMPRLGGIAVVMLVVAIVSAAIRYRIWGALRGRPNLRAADHVLGSLLGVAEGALLIAAIGWTVATFERPLSRLHDELAARPELGHWLLHSIDRAHVALQTDPAGQLLMRTNPLLQFELMRAVQQAADVATDVQAREQLFSEQSVRELSELPPVKRHLDLMRVDRKLREALEQRDLAAIMSSDAFAAMLADRAVRQAVLAWWERKCRPAHSPQSPKGTALPPRL